MRTRQAQATEVVKVSDAQALSCGGVDYLDGVRSVWADMDGAADVRGHSEGRIAATAPALGQSGHVSAWGRSPAGPGTAQRLEGVKRRGM